MDEEEEGEGGGAREVAVRASDVARGKASVSGADLKVNFGKF